MHDAMVEAKEAKHGRRPGKKLRRMYVEKSKKGLKIEECKSVHRVAILNSFINSLERNGNSAGRKKEEGCYHRAREVGRVALSQEKVRC